MKALQPTKPVKILAPILLLALTILPVNAFAQADEPLTVDPVRPGAARPGLYLGLDTGVTDLDLDDGVKQRFEEAGLALSPNGAGGGVFLGYSWSNEFALELQLNGSNMSAGDVDLESGLGEFVLAARAPLRLRSRVSPYLQGHLGVGVIAFSGSEIDDRALVGGMTGIGGGVEVHLTRHFAVDFGYRFSVINYQQEILETETGDEEIDFDGSARSHRFMMRGSFSF